MDILNTRTNALVATAELTLCMLHADSHKPARVPKWIDRVLKNG